ncbi:hypothetical protein YQE_04558, partial [Dendroctonus ponderosae]
MVKMIVQMAKMTVKMNIRSLDSSSEPNNTIQPMTQLLLVLRYYATGSHLIAVGYFFGVSKTSPHRIVHRVTAAGATLARNDIKLPSTKREISAAQVIFYALARLPKLILLLDCTHIKVQSFGGDNAEVFRNRKGYFSITVQGTCDYYFEEK